MLFLLCLISSAQADWVRIQSSTPIRNKSHIFVATYMHRGEVDVSLPKSWLHLYLTVVYDLTKNPIQVYTKITYDLPNANAAQYQAEEYAVTKIVFENRAQPIRQFMPPSPYGGIE